jgi:hypothetical protein
LASLAPLRETSYLLDAKLFVMSSSYGSTVFIQLALALSLISCRPSDEKLKAEINERLSMIPGISATVKDGKVTLHGTVKDEVAKSAVEDALKEIKGIRSIEDSAVIFKPPVAAEPVPVALNADQQLQKTLDSVYRAGGITTVDAFVKDGTITLEGAAKSKDISKVLRITRQYSTGKIENNITRVNR